MFTLLILQDFYMYIKLKGFLQKSIKLIRDSRLKIQCSIFEMLMLNSIVDRYTDIGYKIYNEKSWTQNHNIKTDVATNSKHKS